MEALSVKIDAKTFDEMVHGTVNSPTLPECADLKIAVKENATQEGAAAIVIGWTAKLPDGSLRKVQATTTLRAFLMAVEFLQHHPKLQEN